jgi:hypothetical protein
MIFVFVRERPKEPATLKLYLSVICVSIHSLHNQRKAAVIEKFPTAHPLLFWMDFTFCKTFFATHAPQRMSVNWFSRKDWFL